jgi:hypothetical protein
VTALPNRINQSPGGPEIVTDILAPIKEHACLAMHALLRGRPRRAAPGPTLMQRGAERC